MSSLSPPWERARVRGTQHPIIAVCQGQWNTLTPTLSRQGRGENPCPERLCGLVGNSKQKMRGKAFTGKWVQYRLALRATNSGGTPRVTEVALHFEQPDLL